MPNIDIWTPDRVYSYIKNNLSDKKLILPVNAYCSQNFSWNEILCTSKRTIVGMPDLKILSNLYYLTSVLQIYRAIVNYPFLITSGWRTADEQNKLIRMYASGQLKNKPSETSLHLEGLALDFVVCGVSQKVVQDIIDKSFLGEAEFGKDYTHIGLTSFSEKYLLKNGLFYNWIYKKLCLEPAKLSYSKRCLIIKRLNPKNWQSLSSNFSFEENKRLFERFNFDKYNSQIL